MGVKLQPVRGRRSSFRKPQGPPPFPPCLPPPPRPPRFIFSARGTRGDRGGRAELQTGEKRPAGVHENDVPWPRAVLSSFACLVYGRGSVSRSASAVRYCRFSPPQNTSHVRLSRSATKRGVRQTVACVRASPETALGDEARFATAEFAHGRTPRSGTCACHVVLVLVLVLYFFVFWRKARRGGCSSGTLPASTRSDLSITTPGRRDFGAR